MKHSKYSQARAVWIVLFFAGASVAVVELGLRLFAPAYTVGIQEAYQYDPELGYRLKAGIHLLKTTDYQQETYTNKLGTANFQESFKDYQFLVLALGDSFTQGSGLPADAAYPFQLDLTLNRDANGIYSKRYAVVNLGLEGAGCEQALILLRRYASLIGKPDIVLYLGVNNDYEDDVLFRSGYRRPHLVDGSPYWGWMLRPVRWAAKTELGKRAQIASGWWRRSRALRPASGESMAPGDWSLPPSELERPVLERLAQACEEYHALLVVSWISAPSPSYDWLKTWAAGKGVAFADWLPSVTSVWSAMPNAPVLNPHSGGHRRTWVKRLIAEEYARQILARQR